MSEKICPIFYNAYLARGTGYFQDNYCKEDECAWWRDGCGLIQFVPSITYPSPCHHSRYCSWRTNTSSGGTLCYNTTCVEYRPTKRGH